MNRNNIITISTLILILLLIACQRDRIKQERHENERKQSTVSAPPSTSPTHQIGTPTLTHQYYRLSIGFLKLLTDPNICNNGDLLNDLVTKVNANGKDPIQIGTWYSSLLNSNFTFNTPSTSDLYDCLKPQILGNNPPTAIDNWQLDFFSSFQGLWAPGQNISAYTTTIGIPDISAQTNNNLNKPILILPDPESVVAYIDIASPLISYYWDQNANNIVEIPITDINQYYDLIDDGNYFVIALSFKTIENPVKEVTWGCEEAWVADDDFCDGHCGENIDNSPNDCNPSTKRKKLYLRQLRINDDFKDRNSTGYHEKRHWESLLQGNYEPSVGCVIVHANAKATAIQKISLEKISIDNIKRSKKKKNGTIVSSGTSSWIDAQELDEPSTLRAIEIGDNFNPNTDNIFFAISERTRKQQTGVPYIFNSINFFTAIVMNTCITSNKEANNYQGTTQASNYIWYNLINNNYPSIWATETMTLNGVSQTVKVLKRNFGNQNDCDYEIYYLDGQYEW